MSGTIDSTSTSACYLHFKGDISEASYTNFMASDPPAVKTATIINNKFYYMTIRCNLENVTFSDYRVRPMIVMESETDFTYEPYNANIYSVTFPSSAGTVYRGELTVNKDGSGKLLVDWWGKELIDSENFSSVSSWEGEHRAFRYSSTNRPTAYATSAGTSVGNCICSHFKVDGVISSSTVTGFTAYNNYLQFRPANVANITDEMWQNWVTEQYQNGTPLTVAYKIREPITYDLTALQVRSLFGINNIWADTGSISYINYFTNNFTDIDEYIKIQNNSNIATLSET